MRLVASVVAASLACGACSHPGVVRNLGIGVSASGIALAGYALVQPCLFYAWPNDGAGQSGGPYESAEDEKASLLHLCKETALVGGILATVGMIMAIHGQSAQIRQAEEAQQRESRRVAPMIKELVKRNHDSRERAWRMTREAADAARLNDCATVVARAGGVYNLDRDMYATVFVRDVAIQRCLPPPPPPLPPPPALPPPPPPRDPIKDREQAFALVQDAKKAARAENCGLVLEIEKSISLLDASVFDAWFMRDERIKACLAIPDADAERQRSADWRAYYAKHEPAVALTRQARDKARAGDCAGVIALGIQLEAQDREFHDGVYMKLPEITKCVPTTPGAEPTPAPSPPSAK